MARHNFIFCFVLFMVVQEGCSLECWISATVNGVKTASTKMTCLSSDQQCGKTKYTTTALGTTMTTEADMCLSPGSNGCNDAYCTSISSLSPTSCEATCCSTDLCNSGMGVAAGYLSLILTVVASITMYLF